MPSIGFLHTAEGHVETFRALVAELAPRAADVHVVDEDLLSNARTHGVDDDLRARLLARLRRLERQVDVIVCTCSTLAGEAECLGHELSVPVVRVDRPMAEEAVRMGRRVAVVATVEATLDPTRRLLEECADGTDSEVSLAPCLQAWDFFEAGDPDRYAAAIAEHVRGLADTADVVVLAQVSMAPAATLLGDLAVPVLTSPRSAVEEAVRHLAH
jgi:Asp/Glu/hydantoin racemase